MTLLPQVSVIVPCRNERTFIQQTLDSILANDYPKECLEIFVVDGESNDGTREILSEYSCRHPLITVVNNPKKTAASAMNLGLSLAKGEVILRMDAHCVYPSHYIHRLTHYLLSEEIDNVGGVCITLPVNDTIVSLAIATSISHPFGVGNSYFRIGVTRPKVVDSVPFGCFRKKLFDRVGLFDENLIRNQDEEMNFRICKQGGRILLVPDVYILYYARDTLKKLWRMYFQYGFFKPLVAKKIPKSIRWRHGIPSAFVIGLFLPAALMPFYSPAKGILETVVSTYLAVNLFFSIRASIKKRKAKLILPLFASFFLIHFGYGLGFLKGTIIFIFMKRDPAQGKLNLSLSR